MARNKLKIAIIDLTDCEGCQVELVSMKEKLLALADNVEILNWRLGQEKKQNGPYDLALVEGSPITKEEIEILKNVRGQSALLVALGTCATLGGIPAMLDKKKRKFWYKKIYGPKYKPSGIDAIPLSAIVKVDYFIHGCPVRASELERVLGEILAGRLPKSPGYSVCFECKAQGNQCRLISKKPCLGPITQGGCQAICISGGEMCWGCFGPRRQHNKAALLKILAKISKPEEIEKYFSMFWHRLENNHKNNKKQKNG